MRWGSGKGVGGREPLISSAPWRRLPVARGVVWQPDEDLKHQPPQLAFVEAVRLLERPPASRWQRHDGRLPRSRRRWRSRLGEPRVVLMPRPATGILVEACQPLVGGFRPRLSGHPAYERSAIRKLHAVWLERFTHLHVIRREILAIGIADLGCCPKL